MWGSAEHNIKDTRSDVLVIFDCCHAGELERNVRGNFTRRAFEFLAATSANSTTKKPGKHSFTSALIWSLSHLLEKHVPFSTQELLRTILNDAPDFPTDQSPRLSERPPACLRKIMLAPLTTDSGSKPTGNSEADEEEEFTEETRQELTIRLVFNSGITPSMVKEVASHLGRLIRDSDIKAKAALWEGINMPLPFQLKDSTAVITQFYVHKWLNQGRKKDKSLGDSPTGEVSPPEVSKPVLNQDSKPASSPPSIDGSFVTTPDPSRSIPEPEIGEHQEASRKNSMTPDNFPDDISLMTHSNVPRNPTGKPKNSKRGLSISSCSSDSDGARKRRKVDARNEAIKN